MRNSEFSLGPISVYLVWLLSMIIFFWPGFMSTDSLAQLQQAKGIAPYQDAHPVIMARIWHYLDLIWPGPTLMMLTQLFLFSASIWLIINLTIQNSKLRSILLAFVLFSLPIFSILGVVWKDIWMINFFLAGLYFFSKALKKSSKTNQASKKLILLGILFFAFGSLFRANALGAAIVTTLAFTYTISKFSATRFTHTLALPPIYVVLLLITYLLGSHISKSGIDVTDQNFEIVTMGFDLAGMSVSADEKLFEPGYKTFISDNTTLTPIRVKYNPRYHACLFKICRGPAVLNWDSSISHEEVIKIRQNWINAIIKNPSAWLDHRLKVAKQILNIEGTVWAPTLKSPFVGRAQKEMGYEPWDPSWRTQARLKLMAIAEYSHRVYIYLALLVLLFVICAIKIAISPKGRMGNSLILMYLLAGISYQGTILVGATSADFRYSHFMITCTILSWCLFFGLQIESNQLEKDTKK